MDRSNYGFDGFKAGTMNKVFNIIGKISLVENIPVLFCPHCQEPILRVETKEHIRLLLNSGFKPKKKYSYRSL